MLQTFSELANTPNCENHAFFWVLLSLRTPQVARHRMFYIFQWISPLSSVSFHRSACANCCPPPPGGREGRSRVLSECWFCTPGGGPDPPPSLPPGLGGPRPPAPVGRKRRGGDGRRGARLKDGRAGAERRRAAAGRESRATPPSCSRSTPRRRSRCATRPP